uniref:Uncharacterized protein n=1 Tax=Micrurus lemniscatus lemniscatus TaxID=129467 RepID=A0A2D4JMZ3_MICLE
MEMLFLCKTHKTRLSTVNLSINHVHTQRWRTSSHPLWTVTCPAQCSSAGLWPVTTDGSKKNGARVNVTACCFLMGRGPQTNPQIWSQFHSAPSMQLRHSFADQKQQADPHMSIT